MAAEAAAAGERAAEVVVADGGVQQRVPCELVWERVVWQSRRVSRPQGGPPVSPPLLLQPLPSCHAPLSDPLSAAVSVAGYTASSLAGGAQQGVPPALVDLAPLLQGATLLVPPPSLGAVPPPSLGAAPAAAVLADHAAALPALQLQPQPCAPPVTSLCALGRPWGARRRGEQQLLPLMGRWKWSGLRTLCGGCSLGRLHPQPPLSRLSMLVKWRVMCLCGLRKNYL